MVLIRWYCEKYKSLIYTLLFSPCVQKIRCRQLVAKAIGENYVLCRGHRFKQHTGGTEAELIDLWSLLQHASHFQTRQIIRIQEKTLVNVCSSL